MVNKLNEPLVILGNLHIYIPKFRFAKTVPKWGGGLPNQRPRGTVPEPLAGAKNVRFRGHGDITQK